MLLIALTALPAVAIAVYFITSDKFVEPTGTILFSLFLGLVICFPAGVLNTLLIWNHEDPHSLAYLAAITEEPLKFLMIFLFLRSRTEFDEPMDALVYGTVVSLGFAILENFTYVYGADSETSSFAIAALRAFTAIPMHASCGVVMGYYFGRYMFSGSRRYLFMSLAVPIFFHASYNFLASIDSPFFLLLLIVLVVYCLRLHKVFIQEQKLKSAEAERKLA
jgi:RsiW-degrading membrane proteinase PrsW (M82 family)